MTSPIPPHLRDRAVQGGKRAFGDGFQPRRWAYAPGRLELLGNHVDYNGGLVLAGAIDRMMAIAIDPSGQPGIVNAVAGDVSPEPFAVRMEDLSDWRSSGGKATPETYLRGIIAALLAKGIVPNSGVNLSLAGDVPLGFGMSSSASLCVSLVLALSSIELSPRDVVLIARDAEHRAGSPVGAMDQSASVAGGIILFDGRDTSFTPMSPNLDGYVFAVADSGVSHALGVSSYPTRVKESAEAVAWLREHGALEIETLGDLTPSTWEDLASDVLSSVLSQRVNHVVAEIERVREGVQAVEQADWGAFGQLMTASGRSSATEYEISHPRVEDLVAEINAIPGVLGARMMGGGEGGPALALISQDAVDEVATRLQDGFFARYPDSEVQDRFQVCVFGPGAGRIED